MKRGGRPRSGQMDVAFLHATRALVAEQGYRKLTMEAVASRAGFPKQALYRRWARKPLLVFAATLGDARAVEAQLPDTGSFAEDVNAVIAEQARIYRTPQVVELVQGILGDCLAEESLMAELRMHFLEPRLAMFERIADRAQSRGELFDAITPRTVAHAIAGAMFAEFVVFGGASADFPAELARLATKGLA